MSRIIQFQGSTSTSYVEVYRPRDGFGTVSRLVASNSSTSATGTVQLFLPNRTESAAENNRLWPSVRLAVNTVLEVTDALPIPAGRSLWWNGSSTNINLTLVVEDSEG